jgi:hypothetical protein
MKTMTLAQLEDELREARLRGAEDHTPVFKLFSDGCNCKITTVNFNGVVKIQ